MLQVLAKNNGKKETQKTEGQNSLMRGSNNCQGPFIFNWLLLFKSTWRSPWTFILSTPPPCGLVGTWLLGSALTCVCMQVRLTLDFDLNARWWIHKKTLLCHMPLTLVLYDCRCVASRTGDCPSGTTKLIKYNNFS
jgi:hypothetical protein